MRCADARSEVGSRLSLGNDESKYDAFEQELLKTAVIARPAITIANRREHMDVQRYKRRLHELETELLTRTMRDRARVREQTIAGPGDIGDSSVADEQESLDVADGERDGSLVQQVRDALQRIDDGTFGLCVVDGEPIEPSRLEAVPWTPYCLKHQAQAEAAAGLKMPTL